MAHAHQDPMSVIYIGKSKIFRPFAYALACPCVDLEQFAVSATA